jgi:hypothetical protein
MAAAEAARVPWSYDLPVDLDEGYRAWLAAAYVRRLVGEFEGDPPAGAPSRDTIEVHLAALGDFTCRPLYDFGESWLNDNPPPA